MQANMGMAGEFRCVVKRADGSTKIDTGYQKNLILNQGLDFFGGGNGDDMMAYCVIGSGNSTPTVTQTTLDSIIKQATITAPTYKYDYNQIIDGNLYKPNKVGKYSFTNIDNVNVSELGLASRYDSNTSYHLCTRALIKDSNGNPTTITVLSGEQLDIYYKLWCVIDISDTTGVVNVSDGIGGMVPYNYVVRASDVGYSIEASGKIGRVLTLYLSDKISTYSGDLATIQNRPSNQLGAVTPTNPTYILGSYKYKATAVFGTSVSNGNIRTITFAGINSSYMPFQIRFGSVANDSPITKTNTQTLTIPFEISWGRYEGAL